MAAASITQLRDALDRHFRRVITDGSRSARWRCHGLLRRSGRGGRVPCSARIASRSSCSAMPARLHWSESDFQLVTINGAPGLLMRHPISGNGTYSFDIADGRIRAIYVVRNPDKLRGFLEHTH